MGLLKIEITRNFTEVREIGDSLLIGRGEESDVILLDKGVSRNHARAYCDPAGAFFIEDVGSSNGIRVNGDRVIAQKLGDGDIVEIGRVRMFFSLAVESTPDVVVDLCGKTPEQVTAALAPADTSTNILLEFTGDQGDAVQARLLERFNKLPQMDEVMYMSLETALNEGIGNAVRHGHKWDNAKMVQLHLETDPEKLVIRIKDQGPGFDYRAMLKRGMELDAAAAARERAAQGGMGGLGILMMLRCMDSVEYNQSGNQLKMVKYLTEEARVANEPPPPSPDPDDQTAHD